MYHIYGLADFNEDDKKKMWDNRDTDLKKKNKKLKYSKEKFCDRFIKR